jgi:hypothetical protein
VSDELQAQLRAEAETAVAIDLAHHAGDRVHQIVKMHAMTLPTVSAAIAFGLLLARQVADETIAFAIASMDGDTDDAAAIRTAARRLLLDLLEEQRS